MTRFLTTLVVFACLAGPGLADVTGDYTAKGRNADGSVYSGTARLTETDGMVTVNWTVGTSSYSGTGPINGDVVTIDWGAASPVVYVVMPDGELHGTWADGAALEKLTPR
ncbi:hypothetical protein [Maritimibacter sp. DP1N21-5]|uniref:LIC10280 family protein n=1 Tax=Maritimibacter sp. DP1N21-5 TaxID=2836867 RepID=UPI001C45189E|nr:hypothetical protein [Maritimibacter sp. DP1N21-5]MBV7408052.1 hypothetical protein [Maritimibacter sp. DP1N21-5]